jgi:hypothetical protein
MSDGRESPARLTGAPGTPVSGWSILRAACVGAFLVAVMTAPTVTRITGVGRVDTNDGRFSIWNIAWIDHALLSSPSHLLDANIFYPHTGTLAYSELNLVAGVLGLPWYAATGSPLAALNGSVATALWLCFLCMWALVRRLTADDGAGLVAAVAFTFCPYVVARTAHVQLLMIFAFPLVFLAFHRLRDDPTVARGAALGAALAVAALACGYYGLFAGCALGAMALVFASRSRAYWLALTTALVTTAVLVGPVYVAFTAARARSGAILLPHDDESVRGWSANVTSYLASSSAAHEWWLPWVSRWQPWSDVLFPGVGTLALAAVGGVALARGSARARRVLSAYLAVAVLAAWASFGPDLGLYRLLNATVPGMTLIRAPARFGVLVTFALAVLAGFGAGRLSGRRRWMPAVLVVMLACELGVKTAEWGWPSWPLRVAPPVSPAYQRLAELPRGVLVEFQFPYVSSNYHNHATAMYWSTYHWMPLVNGYSDVVPPDFDDIALPINGFPDPRSFAIMHARQVRYVLWHVDYYEGTSRHVLVERLSHYTENLRPLVKTPDTWLYEIVKWPE